MLTLDELSKDTGLSLPFLRKCLNQYREIFKSYIKRGDKNSLLFDNNGVMFFRKISQLKQEGLGLQEIARYLKNEQEKITEQTSNKDITNIEQTDILLERLLQEKDARRKDAEEYNKRIIELEKLNAQLQLNLKLLTDGKTPEQIKTEHDEKQKEKFRIIAEYQNTSIFKFRKRKALLKKIEILV
jgi:hypothetical protein